MQGVRRQINAYKSARGQANRKSDPSPGAVRHARDTAMGRTQKSTRRASWEGLDTGKSTHIQMKDTGYLNPGHQKKRMSPSRRAQLKIDRVSTQSSITPSK